MISAPEEAIHLSITNSSLLHYHCSDPSLLANVPLQDSHRTYANFQGRHKLCLTTRGPTGLLADLSMAEEMEQLETEGHLDEGGYWVWEEVKTPLQVID